MITSIMARKRFSASLKKIAAVLFWAAVWQGVSMAVGKEVLVPSPADVLVRMSELTFSAGFWQATAFSLLRIGAGCLLGTALGCVTAVLTCKVNVLDALISPMISVIRSTPVASFILLALVWLKKDSVPLFIVTLMVLPIIWTNVCEGIRSTDLQLLEMARIFRFSHTKKLGAIYFPSVLPFFAAGFTTSIGLSWKAGIAAEVLAVPLRAIGTQLYYSKIYLETVDLFAWTLTVIILSLILEKLFRAGMKKYGKAERRRAS